MPIFEYTCNKCGEELEILTRAGKEPECTSCHSKSLTKKFSVFAVNSGDSNTTPDCTTGGCPGFNAGTCGSGMCGSN